MDNLLIPRQEDRIICLKVGGVKRENLYEMVRKYWVVNLEKASNATHVLAIIDGIVKAVYIPTKWQYSEVRPDRCEFWGYEVADSLYIGKNVTTYYGKSQNPVKYINMEAQNVTYKKYSLKDLINKIGARDLSKYKNNTKNFIDEAKKGVNWTEWDPEIFYAYFEQMNNGVANLGNGQMSRTDKSIIKEHWMELAPHLKAIAESQDEPLWDTYRKVREIIRKCTDTNKQIATNRMIACLQPNVLCTEIFLERLNVILEGINMYTNTIVPHYDYTNWEEASHTLLKIIHSTIPQRDPLDYANIPWDLYDIFNTLKTTGQIPTYWIFPWNPKQFRLHEYFLKYDVVDWIQGNYNVNVGDFVYIYGSSPEKRLRYYLQVIKKDIPYNETIDDKEYGSDNHPTSVNFCRLNLLSTIDTESLSLDLMCQNGLKARPQGKQRINAKLLSYIQSCLKNVVEQVDPTELKDSENIFEGAKKTIIVNQYERNPIARQKCIEKNGCTCKVCGINFEEMYGEIGRGFIHVHHIIPISKIGELYQIDPINDLVPVCPNCHAMLHRGKNGDVLTVDELKSLLNY